MRDAVRRLVLGGLVGKLLGLLREVLLAAAYGTGVPTTATRVAQTGTLVPVDLFTADVLTAGFLPLHKELLTTDPARAATLFRGVRVALRWLAAVLTLGSLALAPVVVDLLAPGLAPATAATCAQFLRVMALGIPSYLQFSLLSYLEISHGGFRLSSARATAQNLGMLLALGLAWVLEEPVVLAGGFAAAYLVLHAWGYRSVRARGFLPAAGGGGGRELRSRLWRRVRPLLLLPVVLQGSVVAERVVASLMGDEVVAAVDYARFVATTGVNLVAVPLGLAGLAALAGLGTAAARERLAAILPGLLLVVAPVSVVLAVGSSPVVEVLYARGAFDAAAVSTSASVLAGLGLGFWAQSCAYVLVKALNAADRNRVAAGSLLAGLVVTLVLNVALHAWLGPVTLGLASSAGAVVTAAVAAHALGVGALLRRWVGACVPVAGAAWLLCGRLPAASGWPGLLGVGGCVLVVFGLAAALLPPWRRVVRSLVR
ncbi:putative peptidoglycan lipid II flippase [Kineococcus radiotolerans]|uniref:Putative peptidoglycan lipid II flippase n=1 Tax=Kineococcus radiotolerans TaxID=131568 RepID=A0A7W4TMS8_KINRA|nr:lipid II flippase MurJ [Kineococcus radiotolerans]MBB2901362.1 putative peptidoglycan lipid II flippase [Kineococcus radiotolerans]